MIVGTLPVVILQIYFSQQRLWDFLQQTSYGPLPHSQGPFLFLSLAILVSHGDILFSCHIQRNVLSSIKVLYGLFVTCTKSWVAYFLFCVHYSKRFCQGTHNTFLLRRALWQSFCDTFHSFLPNICRLIFAGDVSRSSLQIFFSFMPTTSSFTVFLTKRALILTALVWLYSV